MKKRAAVFTENDNLFNKIRLLLRDIADVDKCSDNDSTAPYSTVLWDIDTMGGVRGGVTTMSKHAPADIPLPFKHEDILATIDGDNSNHEIRLSGDGHSVYINGERIKLSKREFKLLSRVAAAGSGYVSREQLLTDVWGEDFTLSNVNVYIHYLRRKIERDNVKIILFSNPEGYTINKNYKVDTEHADN